MHRSRTSILYFLLFAVVTPLSTTAPNCSGTRGDGSPSGFQIQSALSSAVSQACAPGRENGDVGDYHVAVNSLLNQMIKPGDCVDQFNGIITACITNAGGWGGNLLVDNSNYTVENKVTPAIPNLPGLPSPAPSSSPQSTPLPLSDAASNGPGSLMSGGSSYPSTPSQKSGSGGASERVNPPPSLSNGPSSSLLQSNTSPALLSPSPSPLNAPQLSQASNSPQQPSSNSAQQPPSTDSPPPPPTSVSPSNSLPSLSDSSSASSPSSASSISPLSTSSPPTPTESGHLPPSGSSSQSASGSPPPPPPATGPQSQPDSPSLPSHSPPSSSPSDSPSSSPSASHNSASPSPSSNGSPSVAPPLPPSPPPGPSPGKDNNPPNNNGDDDNENDNRGGDNKDNNNTNNNDNSSNDDNKKDDDNNTNKSDDENTDEPKTGDEVSPCKRDDLIISETLTLVTRGLGKRGEQIVVGRDPLKSAIQNIGPDALSSAHTVITNRLGDQALRNTVIVGLAGKYEIPAGKSITIAGQKLQGTMPWTIRWDYDPEKLTHVNAEFGKGQNNPTFAYTFPDDGLDGKSYQNLMADATRDLTMTAGLDVGASHDAGQPKFVGGTSMANAVDAVVTRWQVIVNGPCSLGPSVHAGN